MAASADLSLVKGVILGLSRLPMSNIYLLSKFDATRPTFNDNET